MKLIDLIIPLYNGEATISECLDGISAQQVPDGWGMTITIVDDASTDDSATVVSDYEELDIRLVTNLRNLGRAKTRNLGMRQGGGEIVVFLDCDCVFDNPLVLRKFIELITDGHDCVFANVVSSQDDFSGRFTNETARKRFKEARRNNFMAMTSACLAIRRSVLVETGGFCEEYSHYGFEDRDFIAMLLTRRCRIGIHDQCLVNHIEIFDPQVVAQKFFEAAKYSAPVFYHRFPDMYRQTLYGKIDPRVGTRLPGFFYPLAIWFLPLIEALATKSTGSGIAPYPVGKILLKLTSALAYLGGCFDNASR